MEYGIFKALQALLFFGAAFGFGIWELIKVNREIRNNIEDKRTGDRFSRERR